MGGRGTRVSGWSVYLVVGLLAAGVYFFVPQSLKNFWFNAIGLSSAVTILIGIRVHRPSHALAWYAMALGQFLTFSGDFTFTIYENVLGKTTPFPSWADVAYLAGYVPLAIGLALLVRARRPGHDRASIIDAGIVSIAAAVAMWVFLIAPQPHDTRVTGQVVSIAYPMVDLALIAFASRLVFAARTRASSITLLTGSLVSLVVADVVYALLNLHNGYYTGHPVDAAWMISYVLWGTAALHPSMRQLTVPGASVGLERLTRGRLAILGSAALLTPFMLGVQWFRHATLYVPVMVVGSAVAFVLVLIRLAGLSSALEAAAHHDQLTGLPNRRLLIDRLGNALSRAQRSRSVVSVLFCDVAGFKAVNDKLGHDAGDEVLVEIGRRLRAAVRAGDTIARFGGDEFVVVCEGLDGDGLRGVAERVRRALEDPLLVQGVSVPLSLNIGSVSALTELSADELLKEADRDMYRNKVGAASPPSSSAPVGDVVADRDA